MKRVPVTGVHSGLGESGCLLLEAMIIMGGVWLFTLLKVK